MADWVDATHYDSWQHDTIEPTSWVMYIQGARIWLGRGHPGYPGRWVAHCVPIHMNLTVIGQVADITVGEAQRAALELVRSEAGRMADRCRHISET